MQIESII